MSDSHIRIKNEFYRLPEYIKFEKSVKATLYRFLQAHIVRHSKEVKNYTFGAQYIYREHFLKGQLVSRYSQKRMAEYLQTSQGRINRYLLELEKDGFIKKIRRKVSNGIACYYQFGTWDGKINKPSYEETIWLDEYFSNLVIDRKNNAKEKNSLDLDVLYPGGIEAYFGVARSAEN